MIEGRRIKYFLTDIIIITRERVREGRSIKYSLTDILLLQEKEVWKSDLTQT